MIHLGGLDYIRAHWHITTRKISQCCKGEYAND